IPVHLDPEPDQPERQLGGEVARRAPRGAVVDTEAVRQPPAGKGQAELLPDGRGGDEAPGAGGGRPRSRASRHCTRRPTEANLLVRGLECGSSPSRPSATSHGARSRGPCRPSGDVPEEPETGRPWRTDVAALA